jgi:hypothetical protein
VRALVILAVALAAAAALPAQAEAARECQGLAVCIPVAGPWVVVPPPPAGASSSVQYLLRCAPRSVVAGTDALVSDPMVDVAFLGQLGSPVSPGVTTHASAVFIGTYVGPVRRPSSFQPYVGCVPTSGGGGRGSTAFSPTAALVVGPPGQPLVRRARSFAVRATGVTMASMACARGERLVGGTHALAFPQKRQPPIEWLGDVHAARRIVDDRLVATATRGEAVPARTRVELQLQALCARAG